ncbi:MAG: hypothetical protein M2R45_03086 [Verrucomicrobia subdivision 3 bacterium]|nr:hypothetical protein [Limisphaerales bacterium]MCS1416572.1 hypothetical protein [Limisphaerales bacterium]
MIFSEIWTTGLWNDTDDQIIRGISVICGRTATIPRRGVSPASEMRGARLWAELWRVVHASILLRETAGPFIHSMSSGDSTC